MKLNSLSAFLLIVAGACATPGTDIAPAQTDFAVVEVLLEG